MSGGRAPSGSWRAWRSPSPVWSRWTCSSSSAVSPACTGGSPRGPSVPIADAPSRIGEICSAVDRAAALYFKRAWCLQRSATATFLLRRAGFPAEMVIGVQRMPFAAHAWVELDGEVANDRPGVRETYRVIERLGPPAGKESGQ